MEIILALLMKYSHSTFPQWNQRWNFWNQVIFSNLSPSLVITSKFPTISWLILHFWERIFRKFSLTPTRDISCAWNTNTQSYFLSPMKTAVSIQKERAAVPWAAVPCTPAGTGKGLSCHTGNPGWASWDSLLTQVPFLLTDTSIICHTENDKSGLKQHIKIHWKEPYKMVLHL